MDEDQQDTDEDQQSHPIQLPPGHPGFPPGHRGWQMFRGPPDGWCPRPAGADGKEDADGWEDPALLDKWLRESCGHDPPFPPPETGEQVTHMNMPAGGKCGPMQPRLNGDLSFWCCVCIVVWWCYFMGVFTVSMWITVSCVSRQAFCLGERMGAMGLLYYPYSLPAESQAFHL